MYGWRPPGGLPSSCPAFPPSHTDRHLGRRLLAGSAMDLEFFPHPNITVAARALRERYSFISPVTGRRTVILLVADYGNRWFLLNALVSEPLGNCFFYGREELSFIHTQSQN